MNIVLIGPSGAGKGTYAHKLASRFNLKHLSIGDFLRLSFEDKSALGLLAQKYMRDGELVPDEVIDAIIEECLCKLNHQQGILFDGFPRTVYQAKYLEKVFAESGRMLDRVFALNVSDEEIFRRLAGRLICRRCQLPHHQDNIETMVCRQPGCGGELFRRDDDIGEIPALRLATYHRDCQPLLDYYRDNGSLISINTERDIDEVAGELQHHLQQFDAKPTQFSKRISLADTADEEAGKTLQQDAFRPRPAVDIVFLGAPGSGKGTQAKYLCNDKNLVQISTGDLFRENISLQTELGNLAKFYIDRGELVPNSVTEQMVKSRLAMDDAANGVILDGFPRTLPQASTLEQMLAAFGRKLTAVFYFEVDDDAVIRRIAGRISCRKCQTPFHNIFNPFRKCPRNACTGEFLYQRQDDTPETVRKRLQTFYQQTKPLIEFYEQQGLLHRIDANDGVEKIRQDLLRRVDNLIE